MTNLELFTKIFGDDRTMSVSWLTEEVDKEKLATAYTEILALQVDETEKKKASGKKTKN